MMPVFRKGSGVKASDSGTERSKCHAAPEDAVRPGHPNGRTDRRPGPPLHTMGGSDSRRASPEPFGKVGTRG